MEILIIAIVIMFIFGPAIRKQSKRHNRQSYNNKSQSQPFRYSSTPYSPPPTQTPVISPTITVTPEPTNNALKLATTSKYFPQKPLNGSEQLLKCIG